MIAASWSFLRLGKCAAHHDCVRAASQRLTNVAAFAHSAVGDDGHVSRCFFEISIARCRAIDCGRHLRNPKSEHTTRSASGSRTNTNQYRRRPALHYLESYVVTDGVSHDHRNTHLTTKSFKIQRF